MEEYKLKAREIVIKMQFQKEPLIFEQAKQCALIAVDELINSHLVLTTTHDLKPSVRCKRYWQQVKQEIERL